MDIIIDLKNYDNTAVVFKRIAARAIITKGNHYLLIYSKYGDYKFPGGGMESGEALEDTLIREVQEETGYQVIRDSIKDCIQVLERRKGTKEELFEMESHYFFCEVEAEAGNQSLDQYEEEYEYKTTWMTLKEAIIRNSRNLGLEHCPWVTRDTRVMEQLMNRNVESRS